MLNKKLTSLTFALLLLISLPLSAIQVLENGYKAEVFATYNNPGALGFTVMTFDDNDNLYLAHGNARNIIKVTPSGQPSIFISGFVAKGMDWGGQTNYGDFLFVVDGSSGFIRKIAPNGSSSNFTASYGFDYIAFDKIGNYNRLLYAVTSGQDSIYSVSTSGARSLFSSFPGTKDGGGPFEFVFDSSGDYGNLMYLNLRFGNLGYEYMSGLWVINYSGSAQRFIPEQFYPNRIDFDRSGNFDHKMFILPAQLDTICHKIWKVQPDASHSDFALCTTTSISDFTFSNNGDMYVTEYNQPSESFIISKISKDLTPAPVSYHVDGSAGNNTNNGLSHQTAFKTIQFAIDKAIDGDTVLVWPGTYSESATNGINFKGKAITVKSAADAAVLQVPDYTAVTFALGETSGSVLSNFVINSSNTAVLALFANPTLTNLTIVNNSNGIIADNASPDISNCIFWHNTNGDIYGCSAKFSYIQNKNLNNGLAGQWNFDDGTANDSSGNGNNGTMAGNAAIITDPQKGKVLLLDGNGDYVNIKDDDSLDILDNLTISAWVKWNDASPINFPAIVQKGIRASHNYFLGTWFTGRQVYFTYWYSGYGYDNIFSGMNITEKAWSFVAVIVSDNTVTFFVDGKYVTKTKLSTNLETNNYDILIGKNADQNSYFNGAIDDVRIYNRALSSNEITELYNYGLNNFDPGFADPCNGDFHLVSHRGRYWPQINKWVLDNVTSPCIDAGDPNIDPNSEPIPNGGRINIGAYGQSPFASMSESKLIGDLNLDHVLDYKDLAILASQWLQKEN